MDVGSNPALRAFSLVGLIGSTIFVVLYYVYIMKTCKKCKKQFPSSIKVGNKKRYMHRRVFCLECSPFGKHNTKDLVLSNNEISTCSRCKESKSKNDFYIRKRGGNENYRTSNCKSCNADIVRERRRQFKKNAVEYKGGKCCKCGYSKCIHALEFHHLDPSKKTDDLSRCSRVGLDESIKKELDGCDLVCANCHRELEYEMA